MNRSILKIVNRLLCYLFIPRSRRSYASGIGNPRRRILFVLPSLSGGGAERVLLTVSTQFEASDYQKALLVLTDSGEVISDIPKFDSVTRAHATRTILSIFYLIGYLWRERPDVVFSTLLRSHVAVYLASRLVPFRPTLVLRSPNMPIEYLNTVEWRGVAARFLSLSYRAAGLVIAQTAEMRIQIIEEHRVPENLVHIARNPIDLERIRGLAREAGEIFSPRKELEVVSVGRLTEQKGLEFLLESFSEVVKRNNQVRLHILGADVENRQADLERLAVALGIGDKVKFWGYQENPYCFIRDADVLAISSRYEGFPNTLLEAIALGTPTVCTRCADGLDAVLDGKRNGFLATFGDSEAFASALLSAHKIELFEAPASTDYRPLVEMALIRPNATRQGPL